MVKDNKKIRENFRKQPEDFRIEVVIHDGQWYTKEKWAKVALVSVKKIEDFIKNTDYLIRSNQSYRVSYDEILRWYKEKGIPLDKRIVPNNFPPKLWGGNTEVEHFYKNPKVPVNILYIKTPDASSMDLIYKKLSPICQIRKENDVIKAFTLSTEYIKEELRKQIDKSLFDELIFRERTYHTYRNYKKFDEDFFIEFFHFYTMFGRTVLAPSQKTLDIFINGYDEQTIQIQDWILKASEKFEMSETTPFSGYLSSVLQKWPYDLPNYHLGIELAKFQRQLKVATDKIRQTQNKEIPTEKELYQEMKNLYTKERFEELYDLNLKWYNFKNQTSFFWEQNNNEKAKTGEQFTYEIKEETPEKENLSVKLLKIAQKEDNFDGLLAILYCDYLSEHLTENFKKELYNALTQKEN